MHSCHHCRGWWDWVGQGTAWARWASTLQLGFCTAPTCISGPLPNTSMPLLYPLWVLISWSCAEKFLDFGLVEGGFLFFGTGCSKPIIPRAFSPPWVYLKTKQNTNLTKVQMQTKSRKLMQNIYHFSNRFCYLWAKQSYNLTYSIFNLKIIQRQCILTRLDEKLLYYTSLNFGCKSQTHMMLWESYNLGFFSLNTKSV